MPGKTGLASGEYDANSVRDRIRQWQEQGGGVIVADSFAINEDASSTPRPDHTSTKRTDTVRTPRKRQATQTSAIDRREASPAENHGLEVTKSQASSTPAKRVVSDGHWRTVKESANDQMPSKESRRSSRQDRGEEKGREGKRSEYRDRRRSEKRMEGHDSSVLQSDPRPERSLKRGRSSAQQEIRKSDEAKCETENEYDDEEQNPTTPDTTKYQTHPNTSDSDWLKPSHAAEMHSGRRRSNRQGGPSSKSEGLDSPGSFSEGRGSHHSKRGNILSQMLEESKKIFTSQPPEQTTATRVPSIEQWLDNTPDPFLEAPEPSLDDIPPLKPSPHKRKVTPQDPAIQNPESNLDSPITRAKTTKTSRHRSRRKKAISTTIHEEVPSTTDLGDDSVELFSEHAHAISPLQISNSDQESAPNTSPTLNRRGANRRASSPVKGRKKTNEPPGTRDGVKNEEAKPFVDQEPSRPEPGDSLRAPRLSRRRDFPSLGGHRLSTIASVETFDTRSQALYSSASTAVLETEANAIAAPKEAIVDGANNLLRRRSSRLARHSDLISVLSLPQAGGKSIKSARSVRTSASRLANATLPDIMRELTTDEQKYTQELRTLVDGVIPVLLTCVLSKSDSAVAAGLFNSSSTNNDGSHFTKPIVDMGIALERLRTLHKRLPQGDHRGFLTWAHGAQRVYSEYLKAWRMGFQDVVVNLAPATEPQTKSLTDLEGKDPGAEEGLPRNENGDVINGDGERVDVAFLLKRPLVRLKYLMKTLKAIDTVDHSLETENLTAKYQKLVEDARQRSDEERSRLEDEAAANIDPTRARDPRTLAPVAGVIIHRNRRVRARDHFALALQHSDGQRVDCRAELILRDEPASDGNIGDLLICEVDEKDRWLLFPPIRSDLVSARNGDKKGEMIIMIRGKSASGSEWQEILSLQSTDENVSFEWVQMLGLTPVPPQISRSNSFVSRKNSKLLRKTSAHHGGTKTQDDSTSPTKSRTPSPHDIAVPIGEQAIHVSKTWEETSPSLPPVREENSHDIASSQAPINTDEPETQSSTAVKSFQNYVDHVNDLRSLPSQSGNFKSVSAEPIRQSWTLKETLGLSGTSNAMGLKRTRAKRVSRNGASSPTYRNSNLDSQSPPSSPTGSYTDRPGEIVHKSPQLSEKSEDIVVTEYKSDQSPKTDKDRPSFQRNLSSTPTKELPFIPKARRHSATAPIAEVEVDPVWSTPPSSSLPASAEKAAKRSSTSYAADAARSDTGQPAPTSDAFKALPLDNIKPLVSQTGLHKHRRSSSPLKHEYEPSTASESSSDSETSTVAHNDTSSTSDSSDEDDLEDGDAPTPLVPIKALKYPSRIASQSTSQPATEGTIKPSDSASQAPYKTVPAQPAKACRTIATIFSWCDTGSWKSLHPDECSIVITPGLIEAFEMSAAHSDAKIPSSSVPIVDIDKFSELASEVTSQNDDVRGERPLVALELTPLVPLRRGTAIDISIRSPPTPNSQITTGNNIMFRSRSPEECEALYALINHSRIHNPTYIALQNARGPFGPVPSFGGPAGRRAGSQMTSNRSSWFSGWGRSSSYRASTKKTASVAPTDSSVGTMSSAFSALKRFSNRGGGGVFNIAKSTIGSRTGGSRANSIYTSSDNSSGSGTSSPIPPPRSIGGVQKEAPIGLSNAKIRLYIRETASKWRDMGSARLTIMHPERRPALGPSPDGRPSSASASGGGVGIGPGHLIHEKRIVINGKTKGEVLLDAQLGESCFERVARTGIAVSVWEDVVGPNGELGVVNAVGGVVGGHAKVYMIQVSSALFIFFLLFPPTPPQICGFPLLFPPFPRERKLFPGCCCCCCQRPHVLGTLLTRIDCDCD